MHRPLTIPASGIERYHGFDYIRFPLAVFVAAWHLHALGPETRLQDVGLFVYFNQFEPSIKDIVYHNLFLMAVPVFMTVSIFLYAVNSSAGAGYFLKRTRRLLALYAFWVAVYYTVEVFARGRAINAGALTGMGNVLTLVASGSFSVYFFFFSLLLMVMLCEPALRLQVRHPTMIYLALYAVSAGAFVVGPYLVKYPGWYSPEDWNPLNFVPYAMGGLLLWSLRGGGRRILGWTASGAAALAVGSAWLEWTRLASIEWDPGRVLLVPSYARVSMLATAMAVTSGALMIERPAPRWLATLSSYSMGIYCLHMLVSLEGPLLRLLPGVGGLAINEINLALSLGLSVLITRLAGRTPWLGRMVR